MSRKKAKEKANAEEEASKNTAQIPNEPVTAQTFDEYQCIGNLEMDFARLCALLEVRHIPAVRNKQPTSTTTETEGEDTDNTEVSQSQVNTSPHWSKPCLQVELESDDPLSAKSLNISGWKIDEQIFRVLEKMLPSMSRLQSLHFWQARLTDQMVGSLVNTVSLCSSLRVVLLEGNPLPKQSYHLLLCEDSIVTHLSLRNNRIGDDGAYLIGSALSTTRSANRNLLSLNLAFNSIGDAGAAYIAQGLRLNRALLFLSLSNNHIGDSGAAHLATILGEFTLTHEEIVERRKLLLERRESQPSPGADTDPSSPDTLPSVPSSTSLNTSKMEKKSNKNKKESSKKDEKVAGNKDIPHKSNKKAPDTKVSTSKGGKLGNKKKQTSGDTQEDKCDTSPNEQVESVEIVNPLLDQSVQCRDGQLILPGNTTLISLSLAGNRITEKSLPRFLSSLQLQTEGGGLLRLCLQRNNFSQECEAYVKIKELMKLRDPLNKNKHEETEQEDQKT